VFEDPTHVLKHVAYCLLSIAYGLYTVPSERAWGYGLKHAHFTKFNVYMPGTFVDNSDKIWLDRCSGMPVLVRK